MLDVDERTIFQTNRNPRNAPISPPDHVLGKYDIEYAIPFQRDEQAHHHLTDDSVACRQLLTELLERELLRTKQLPSDGCPFAR